MNRRFVTLFASLIMVASLGTGCIGNFALSGKVRTFNLETTDNRWGRELLFVVLYVIPVYPFAGAIDMIIVNSIEFWTGTNPINGSASVTPVAQWTTDDGTQITMKHLDDESIDVTLVTASGEEQFLNLTRNEDGVIARDAEGRMLADSNDPLVRELQAHL